MRSVFVYEFITGGGCWRLDSEPPVGSLLAEGTAMRDSLAKDLAAIDSVDEILLFHDSRLPRPELPKQRLVEIPGSCELGIELVRFPNRQTILIAPEFDRQLLKLIYLVGEGILSSPSAAVVELCSNKQDTCDHLRARGIPAPQGISFQEIPNLFDWKFWPAVLKPTDGCGSQGVQIIESFEELNAVDLRSNTGWRLERFHPGLPVSVSLLAGPRGFIALQPCTQHLSDDGRFTYQGGSTPLPVHLAERAKELAIAAAASLPLTKGYLGIDIVLGSAENGSQDVVIEINPRLTTSYLGLRQACEQNLAEAMLKWAAGEPVELTWRPQTFEFAVPAIQ